MNQDFHNSTADFYRRRAGYVLGVLLLVVVSYTAVSFVSAPTPQVEEIGIVREPVDVYGTASAANTLIDDELPQHLGLPELSVTAALVSKLGDQKPLFAYRLDSRWPLASVTKLLTAVVAYDALSPGQIITISPEAVATEGEAGGLSAGERYSVSDLVKAMLTVSSNDAAMALAQAYDKKQLGESEYVAAINKTALFTDLMQQRARDLGMYDTYFGDPSGLSVINQSTLGDVAVLVEYLARQHPEILSITTKREQTILERKSMTRRTLLNINKFAGRSDFLGGKTGYTDEAGGNLVSLFSYQGSRYLIIVLGTTDRFGETEKLFSWLSQRLSVSALP